MTRKADNGNTYVRFVSLLHETADASSNYSVHVVHYDSGALVTRGQLLMSGGELATTESRELERNSVHVALFRRTHTRTPIAPLRCYYSPASAPLIKSFLNTSLTHLYIQYIRTLWIDDYY